MSNSKIDRESILIERDGDSDLLTVTGVIVDGSDVPILLGALQPHNGVYIPHGTHQTRPYVKSGSFSPSMTRAAKALADAFDTWSRLVDEKAAAERGILRTMFREFKARGLEAAIFDGYDDEYLSEFGGSESDFVKAVYACDECSVRVRDESGEIDWAAWIVLGNEPDELLADYSIDVFGESDEYMPQTRAALDSADLRFNRGEW